MSEEIKSKYFQFWNLNFGEKKTTKDFLHNFNMSWGKNSLETTGFFPLRKLLLKVIIMKKRTFLSLEKKHLAFLNINHHLPPLRFSSTEHLLLLCPVLATYLISWLFLEKECVFFASCPAVSTWFAREA